MRYGSTKRFATFFYGIVECATIHSSYLGIHFSNSRSENSTDGGIFVVHSTDSPSHVEQFYSSTD